MITESDLIMLVLACLIGYIDDVTGPTPYHYEGEIVIVDDCIEKELNKHHVELEGVFYNEIHNDITLKTDKFLASFSTASKATEEAELQAITIALQFFEIRKFTIFFENNSFLVIF